MLKPPTRTRGDDLRDAHIKLLKNLDRSHSNMHLQPPPPASLSYEMIGMDLKDAMDAALEISCILREKGL